MSAARVVDGELIGGRYRAVRILGEGGMGEVWQARNETTDRDFAIKFLHARMAHDPLIMQRFLQEAKAAGRLRHPAIADVYDMGYHDTVSGDRVPFIVMELLHGEALDELLQRDKKLPLPLAVTIGKACAEALAVAHKAGIVHRDLKPANVFMHVTGAGELTPKLLDFGVSKLVDADGAESLTVTGVVVGTPTYMSPEQYRSETSIDGRADIWSLGVLLCRIVAGRHPFRGTRMETLAGEITSDAPVSLEGLGLPPDYRAIVARCLEKDRDKRFATAREVADALDALSVATTGATEPSVQTLDVEKKRSRWPLVIGAFVGGSGLVVLAWVTLHGSKVPEKVPPAETTSFASAPLPPPVTTNSAAPSATEPVATAAPATSTHAQAQGASPKHTGSARPSVGAPKPSNAWRSPGF